MVGWGGGGGGVRGWRGDGDGGRGEGWCPRQKHGKMRTTFRRQAESVRPDGVFCGGRAGIKPWA